MIHARESVQMSRAVKSTSSQEYLKGMVRAIQKIPAGFPYNISNKLIQPIGAKQYRAGVIVISPGAGDAKEWCVLLVKQTATPGYWGPPKGSAENSDLTAINTAHRELLEETKIDSSLGRAGDSYFVISRWPQDSTDFLIYFPVLFDSRPEVSLETSELSEYAWVPVSQLLSYVGRVSTPTAHLFQMLSCTELVSEE